MVIEEVLYLPSGRIFIQRTVVNIEFDNKE